MRAATVLTALVLSLTSAGCSRAPQPGPQEAPVTPVAVADRVDIAALNEADPDGGGWSAVASTGDYTPVPCGVALAETGQPRQQSATWRNRGTLTQVRQLRFTDAATARKVTAALVRDIGACPSWIEAGAQVQAEPLTVTSRTEDPPALAEHLSRFTDSGRTELAWLLDRTGATLTSIVVSEPNTGFSTRVDDLLAAAATPAS